MKNERLDLVLIPGWYGYHAGCVPKLHRLRIKQTKKNSKQKTKTKKTFSDFSDSTNNTHNILQ